MDSEVPRRILHSFVRAVLPPRRILDCGCGTGRLARVMESLGCAVVGTDCSEGALLKAVRLERGVYVLADGFSAFQRGGFEGIVLWGVLHHVDPAKWPQWFNGARRLLPRDGVFLVAGFSPDDGLFRGKAWRRSSTTGSACFVLPQETVTAGLEDAGFDRVSFESVRLRDSNRRADRTWSVFEARAAFDGSE